MQLADLLRETLDVDSQDIWENERTPTPVRRFEVRLHTAGLSIRETVAILDILGVQRSHGAVWQWVHRLADSDADPPTAKPSRSTRPLSRSAPNGIGCMRQSISIRYIC